MRGVKLLADLNDESKSVTFCSVLSLFSYIFLGWRERR